MVSIDLWPRMPWRTWSGMPASASQVAPVWRSPCRVRLGSSAASGVALYAGAAARGVVIPVPIGEIVVPLLQLALAAAVYMVLGVSIGALARNQLVAIAIVLGYFYVLEFVLMMIPGVNFLYPILPGGATASLTNFSFLTDALAEQTSLGAASLAAPVMGAFILLAYACVAGLLAILVPLRRDLR